MDKIVFNSKDDVVRLFEWRENNKGLLKHWKPILNSGIIEFPYNGITVNFEWNEETDKIEIKIYIKGNILSSFTMSKVFNGKILLSNQKWFSELLKDSQEEFKQDIVGMFVACMSYMANHIEYVEKKFKNETIKVKKARKGKKKNRHVKMGRKIYTVSVPKENITNITEKGKVSREFTAESWTVRGHYRNLKDGRRIWIKSYQKGKGEKKEDKIYIM